MKVFLCRFQNGSSGYFFEVDDIYFVYNPLFMKNARTFISAILLLILVNLMSCQEDDTPVDPFLEATQYGNVVVTLSGTDPSGNPFSETVDYKYMPEMSFYYSIANPAFEDPNGVVFVVKRRATAIDEIGVGGYWAEIVLYANHDTAAPVFPVHQIVVSMSVMDEDSREYFEASEIFTTCTISDYSYDANTGKLKFKMTSTLPDQENNLPGDLTLAAEVDVTVFKQITSN